MQAPITVSRADALIESAPFSLGDEIVPLSQSFGRVLTQDIIAESDNPPFNRVMLDGIAFNAASSFPLTQIGEVAAGDRTATLPEGDFCMRVMTGAPLPDGADCVLGVEDIKTDGSRVSLLDDISYRTGQAIHARGTDVKRGVKIASKGVVVNAPLAAALAANGYGKVRVGQRARVTIIVTGNELIAVDAPLRDGAVRRSNDDMISNLVKRNGASDVEIRWVSDNSERTERAIKEALEQSDMLILSGGVSMGDYDFVPKALEDQGVRKIFHRVLQRPGAPLWFGAHKGGKIVFGLPGNPVAALCCAARYVVPSLLRAQGGRFRARYVALDGAVDAFKNRTRYVGVSETDMLGVASPVEIPTSGDFLRLAGTCGMVEIPSVESGEDLNKVRFYEW